MNYRQIYARKAECITTLKNEMEAKEDGTIDESKSEPSFAK